MADPKPLTRDQLAKFLPDNEAIRRFERLFAMAGDLLPSDVARLYRLSQEASIDAGIANTKAVEAQDSLKRIASALEVMASNPQYNQPRSFSVDYIDWDENPPHADKVRRMEWSPTNDTLNLHHSDGVTQQVGQETYGRFTNNTGFTIANGTVLGIEPSTNTFVEFIADGTLSPITIVGVTTQEILNGAQGRITVWGRVHDLDTTGTPFGETWAAGEILYVSSTIAGGYTNLKPTATALSMPIAQVLVVHASEGIIAVRPTIEQAEHFGVFSDLTDQVIAAIYTPQAVTFNTTDFGGGISIGSPTSRIVSSTSGLYNFQFSLQLTSTSASTKKVYIWARVNGADMPNTLGEVTITGASTTVVPGWNYVFSMLTGYYFELMIAGDSTNLELTHNAAQVGANGTAAFARPATPSALLSVTHVAQ